MMATAKKKSISGLFIRSKGKSFRRCGFGFTKQGHEIALDALEEDQIERLKNEPNLIVQELELDPDEAE